MLLALLVARLNEVGAAGGRGKTWWSDDTDALLPTLTSTANRETGVWRVSDRTITGDDGGGVRWRKSARSRNSSLKALTLSITSWFSSPRDWS